MPKTEFEATVEFDDDSTADLEMAADKSWDSFLNYFGDAQHVYCVTYSQSPAFIYKMFQNQDLTVDSLEVIVGDNQHDDSVLELTAPLPDDPQKVADALDLIEQYVETVGRFGETRTTKETQAYFYEGVIYFCWAPFVNYYAHHYAEYESAELDKDLPFPFLHGDSDSGKGMLLRGGARLISNGYVQEVTTSDDFIKNNIKRARASDTGFLYIVGDVAKSKIDRDIIKSYWEGKWDGSIQTPTFIFSSNDSTKPKFELRTRMKALDFNVNVSELEKDEREAAAQIAGQADSCNLFPWFAHLFLQRDISLPDQSDRLAIEDARRDTETPAETPMFCLGSRDSSEGNSHV
ncbi:hypothetical protein [Halocatena pleomorpha]|uniref:hypothetical protein n=1 Tax=Halocatena pleomorpha TaxID=1785090 RepID=UPI001C890319|nr:hypothetical protein [Halocatena pleomorpha]